MDGQRRGVVDEEAPVLEEEEGSRVNEDMMGGSVAAELLRCFVQEQKKQRKTVVSEQQTTGYTFFDSVSFLELRPSVRSSHLNRNFLSLFVVIMPNGEKIRIKKVSPLEWKLEAS